MRTVVATEEGTVELAYTWLPFFFAINRKLQEELQEKIQEYIEGKELTEETLDAADDLVIRFIEEKFPSIKGLRDHLESLKYVYLE